MSQVFHILIDGMSAWIEFKLNVLMKDLQAAIHHLPVLRIIIQSISSCSHQVAWFTLDMSQ